jgi:primosomal protein N' (replication factor Y)
VAARDTSPPAAVVVRDLVKVSGHGPPPAVLELAEWAAWRFAMPVATLLRAASPRRNVWSLPEPPDVPAPGDAGGPGQVRPLLRRVAPAHDLLPLVLDVVDRSEGAVLVLVPSAGWAERLGARLRRRGLRVAADWTEAAAGWPVVVGSRRAAWAPVARLGAAVVLDAHDYHDRYDASVVVTERARRAGVPCLLVSPCPTAVQVSLLGPVAPEERSRERSGWAAVAVVDRRVADPRTGLFSEELVQLARRAGRLVCVLNRTGRARLLACAACGNLARCERCGRPVELDGGSLGCRSCGAERPAVCGACGGRRLKLLRIGVSRAREELEALLGAPVGEVSAATSDIPPTPVLVGTEAVLHRVRRADAVCFLDFDQHLLAPRFTAGEEALSLLARASRMVGGREGSVLVQTRVPEHGVLRAAVAGDPGLFTELGLREELRLPPFSALATVRAKTAPAPPGVEVSALADGRWLVRARDHRSLCDAVALLHGGVRVDPTDV